jgi:hypothetical protein
MGDQIEMDHKCYSDRTGKKIRYPTLEDAEGAAKGNTKRLGQKFKAYKCDYCGFYHIGKTKGSGGTI